jgi:hypothetical protein
VKLLAPLLAALLLSSAPLRGEEEEGAPPAPARPRSGRLTYGGSLGFGIGSESWGVSLRGEAGYLVTERLWTGVSGRFTWTHDDRYSPTLDLVDYGAGAYVRYFVFDRFFASTELAWTSYEVRTADPSAGRDEFTSFLVGGGYAAPLGPRNALLLEALYDVTDNTQGLYGSPWLVRFSFVAGF